MTDSDNKYGVGVEAPAKDAPNGPCGPAPIPTQPTKTNNGYVRGGVKAGKLRDSGSPGAHRIGRK